MNPKILSEIVEAIDRMQYGEVVVTVYNSQVVQIEERRKKRFAHKDPEKETSPGK